MLRLFFDQNLNSIPMKFFAILASFLLISCKTAPSYMSLAEIQVNEREAFAGDNAAARKLADYYLANHDREHCVWWNKLAASRGDQVAQENLRRLQQE